MNLSENLKRLRKERNLSQEQLGAILNVSRQAVSKWESGKTYPDIDNLILIRDMFDVTLDDLVIKDDKNKGTIELSEQDNNDCKENDEELYVNLMIGGFIIGISIGFITDNFMWGIAGSLIGMGVGYIIEYIKNKV